MRILLDENTPSELAASFSKVDACHVDELGLKGVVNGELLKIARKDFDVLVTFDKGIFHQHNHSGASLIIVLLRMGDVRKETALRHAAELEAFLLTLAPGTLVEFAPK